MLFAIVLSAIIFSIAIGMMDISLKEINFSTSSKATNEAFFAADTGAECALYYDLVPAQSFFGPVDAITAADTDIDANCGGSSVNLNYGIDSGLDDDPVGPWLFIIPALGVDHKSCAIVRVERILQPDGSQNTQIISKGYNLGGDTPECYSASPHRVERVLELNY